MIKIQIQKNMLAPAVNRQPGYRRGRLVELDPTISNRRELGRRQLQRIARQKQRQATTLNGRTYI